MEISVIIPAYNRVSTIARAIESVLAQSYKPKEIIVVDDGSSDATSEVVKMYDEVTLLRQKNMGVSAARNNGIMMASCDWVAFLDSDDTWHKDKLKKQVAFHKKYKDILVSYTDEVWIRNELHVKVPKKFAKSNEKLYERSLSHCIIAPSSALLHVNVLKHIGDFNESFEVCEDYDLWLRILKEYEIGLVDEPLITKYAGHDDQLSMKHWGMDRFRVHTLENLHVKYLDDELLLHVLIEKYKVLLAGAKKHEKQKDAFHYEKRIEALEEVYTKLIS